MNLPVIKEGLINAGTLEIAFASSALNDVIEYIDKNPGQHVVLTEIDEQSAANEAVRRLTERNTVVIAIVVTVNDGFALMSSGAADMVIKRVPEDRTSSYFYRMLDVHIKEALRKTQINSERAASKFEGHFTGRVIAIGSSTGGTETLLSILKQIPADSPPILIVQHMPPVFTKLYAERVNALCAINVLEARDGDRLANGLALIAPGDYHMVLVNSGGHYQVSCYKGERVCGQCPSVDVLFNSVASVAGDNAVGVILTGMGADGADGLLKMYKRGAHTIGQDEDTCIVYGMPRAAYERGAVSVQLPLDKIAEEIIKYSKNKE